MPSLGLSLGLGGVRVLGASLNFAALTALPEERRAAVATAANEAAATLGVTPQSVVDALAVGRGLCSMLPNDGCLLASSGGAVTVQGDPVGAIRSWTGVELAAQSNASLQPVSAALGLVNSGNKIMSLGNLSAWVEGEGLCTLSPTFTTALNTLWVVSGIPTGFASSREMIPNYNDSSFHISFGATTRNIIAGQFNTVSNTPFIYNVRTGVGNSVAVINATTIMNRDVVVEFPAEGFLLNREVVDPGFAGSMQSLTLNSALYTTAQRAAVREFCRNYYGVIY